MIYQIMTTGNEGKMGDKMLHMRIRLGSILVILTVLFFPSWLLAREAVVRVAIIPPVSTAFLRHTNYRIRQFPRELTDFSDNAVYEALMNLQQAFGGRISVVQVHDSDLVPGYDSQELVVLYDKIKARETSYFNSKYRENGNKDGSPRVNLLLAWELKCSAEEIEPDAMIPFILHCYLFSRVRDSESKTGVIFKRRKDLTFDSNDSGQVNGKIEDTVLYLIEQFIQTEELDIKREWGGR